MQRRKSNGFTIIEILAIIIIMGIIFALTALVIKKGNEVSGNMTCVEWEDAQVTDCWSYGMGTTCEHRVEKRCVRYDDGSGKTE